MKLSQKSALVLVAALTIGAVLPACPEERKEVVNTVGGAPRDQVDVAKERLNKAEDKLQQNAAAAAVTE